MADVHGTLTATVPAVTSAIITGFDMKNGTLTTTVPTVTSSLGHVPVTRHGSMTAFVGD